MDSAPVRFLLGRQSSYARLDKMISDDDVHPPQKLGFIESTDGSSDESAEAEEELEIPSSVKLMYAANEGDLEGIKELLDTGADVNFRDIDYRRPLHVAACQGYVEAVDFLIDMGADVDPKDRWGSTTTSPLPLFVLAPCHPRRRSCLPPHFGVSQ